ncbi:MAG: thioesterase family protein [Alicyclobacillaceae bacterium]|nr:thioesterase family protein [Alicyclobacillaceae bacterium]
MKEDFRFSYPIRVRYHEIDGQKVVFNAVYLTYMDIAITEYFRHLGISVSNPDHSFDFVLAKTTVEYKYPARYDDILDVFVRTKELKNKSFIVEFETYRRPDHRLICVVETVYVSVDSEKGGAVPIPEFVRRRIEDFEAGRWSPEAPPEIPGL